MKIVAVSSKGGHLDELSMIMETLDNYEVIYITELGVDNKKFKYFMRPGTRSNIIKYVFTLIYNLLYSGIILYKEKPDLIISTGAHTCVPFFWLGRCKKIYIESFAKVNKPSMTGNLIKNTCDIIIVQHEEMLDVYENSVYFGGVY